MVINFKKQRPGEHSPGRVPRKIRGRGRYIHAFIICPHNGFGAAVYVLLLAVIRAGNLLAFGITALKAGSRSEKLVLIAMPVVETYMHENDMLDGYYEDAIDSPLSTPEEIAWAEERLAD